MYKERNQDNCEIPLSRNTFDREKRIRNIDEKNRCDTCTRFENNRVTTEMYVNHSRRKECARNENQKDKEAAEKGTGHTLCCDLMDVQNVPNLYYLILYS